MSLHVLRHVTDIALFVANLERAIDFYDETLGFELERPLAQDPGAAS